MVKNNTEIKLNIGCGPSGINTWLNYDFGILPLLSKLPYLKHFLVRLKILPKFYDINWPKIKLVDIRKKFPLENDSIDYIYCSHVLEHFERWEAILILKECFRILKAGGIIRIVVPDIEKMLVIYKKSKLADGFCRIWYGYNKDIEPSNILNRISRFFIRDHKWNYDKNSIKTLLNESGFNIINFVNFREGKVKDINKLDLENYKDYSLYLEAIKK